MTCVVGLKSADRIYIGADSLSNNGYYSTNRADPKVFYRAPFLFGTCGSPRMRQLLHYRLTVPPQSPDISDREFMATTFVDAVRDCFKNGGFAYVQNNVESGGTFLVAYRDTLYKIDGDFQVIESLDPYMAAGSGNEVALGSLYSTAGEMDDEERVFTALRAAEQFAVGVRSPFNVLYMYI